MNQDRIERNPIVKLTFEFSLLIIQYCEVLEAKRKLVLSNQLLKSGTSIGANIREAQNAESKADFIHKFKIATKEIDETQYWLQLCKYSSDYPSADDLLHKIEEIDKEVSKIISTSKKNNSI